MKKTTIIILSVMLVLALAIPSFAANGSLPLNQSSTPSFVDADGDGVCDNYGTNRNFVDADGDGVCDNCPNGGIALRNGTGMRYGRGGGRR